MCDLHQSSQFPYLAAQSKFKLGGVRHSRRFLDSSTVCSIPHKPTPVIPVDTIGAIDLTRPAHSIPSKSSSPDRVVPAEGYAAPKGGLRAEHMHLPLDVHQREALARFS